MSSAGRQDLKVGSETVPAAAFAKAISELAARAAGPTGTPGAEEFAGYLVEDAGDTFELAERTSLLLDNLASVAAAEAAEEQSSDVAHDAGLLTDEFDESGDLLDSYEAALKGVGTDD
jgi:hypothetical protein